MDGKYSLLREGDHTSRRFSIIAAVLADGSMYDVSHYVVYLPSIDGYDRAREIVDALNERHQRAEDARNA